MSDNQFYAEILNIEKNAEDKIEFLNILISIRDSLFYHCASDENINFCTKLIQQTVSSFDDSVRFCIQDENGKLHQRADSSPIILSKQDILTDSYTLFGGKFAIFE